MLLDWPGPGLQQAGNGKSSQDAHVIGSGATPGSMPREEFSADRRKSFRGASCLMMIGKEPKGQRPD